MFSKANSSDAYVRIDDTGKERGSRLLNVLTNGALASILLLACCGRTNVAAAKTLEAVAVLTPNGLSGPVAGTVLFRQAPGEDVLISGEVLNLAPGYHGFHIHQYGNLTNGCSSTGAHFNPDGEIHGGLDSKTRHAGDFGNIIADATGIAPLSFSAPTVSLAADSKYGIVGRAVVVHANMDDLGKGSNAASKINGNSGPRLGCGVIELI